MNAFASRRALLSGLAALPALNVPVIAATDPHVAYRDRLHKAFAEKHASRPIANVAVPYSIEDEASTLVSRRSWKLCDEVLELPAPRTIDGLGVVALATAIIMEGMASIKGDGQFREDDRTIAVVRAILAVTGEPLPADFIGFGDEPGYLDRDIAYLKHGVGHLPAWALEEARKLCA